jgi:hypothetical protein
MTQPTQPATSNRRWFGRAGTCPPFPSRWDIVRKWLTTDGQSDMNCKVTGVNHRFLHPSRSLASAWFFSHSLNSFRSSSEVTGRSFIFYELRNNDTHSDNCVSGPKLVAKRNPPVLCLQKMKH